MNIFRLHDDPEIAAQMLSTAWRMADNDYADKHAMYKTAY